MSDKDKPVNPFGRGRADDHPSQSRRTAAASSRPQPAPASSSRSAPRAACPVLAEPARRQSRMPAPSRHRSHRWLRRPPPLAAAPTSPGPKNGFRRRRISRGRRRTLPPAPALRVDELVAPNANPIMRAAGPLLQLLGRLRVALMRASFASLMEQVADAIKFFENDIRSAGISEQQANTAKYILCATADDIVQHIPTEDRHVWTQYSMLSRFFGERVGGVRFFEILDRLKADPAGQLSGARTAARLPCAGLPGHAPDLAGRRRRAAA